MTNGNYELGPGPDTPQKDLIDYLRAQFGDAHDKDREILEEEEATAEKFKRSPFIQPCEADSFVPAVYEQLHFKPRLGFDYGIDDIFVRLPRSPQEETNDLDDPSDSSIMLNDVFIQLKFRGGKPDELLHANSLGMDGYEAGQVEQLETADREVEEIAVISSDWFSDEVHEVDGFRVREPQWPSLTIEELMPVIKDASIVPQDPPENNGHAA